MKQTSNRNMEERKDFCHGRCDECELEKHADYYCKYCGWIDPNYSKWWCDYWRHEVGPYGTCDKWKS